MLYVATPLNSSSLGHLVVRGRYFGTICACLEWHSVCNDSFVYTITHWSLMNVCKLQ